jgi:hypothetical protein
MSRLVKTIYFLLMAWFAYLVSYIVRSRRLAAQNIRFGNVVLSEGIQCRE